MSRASCRRTGWSGRRGSRPGDRPRIRRPALHHVALYNLAQAQIALGEYAEARRLVEEGIALSEQTRDLANLAYLLETLAVVESRDGQVERVATLLGAAVGLREIVGANVYAYYLPDESLRESAEPRRAVPSARTPTRTQLTPGGPST